MSIWANELDLLKINEFNKNTLVSHLDISITKLEDDSIEGTMPVDQRTHQPFGVLHGGASCVLAESLGSIASNLCLDNTKFYAVGLEINANHVRPVRDGIVRGVAQNIHLGKTTHIWDIKIYNEDDKLVCISRLTMAVVSK
ncbi:MAG: esterase [Bacteriovorax sp. MedPE-SWde]|nr:MAG: esterase [Bacteriovorax sp. MedPE-SWde]